MDDCLEQTTRMVELHIPDSSDVYLELPYSSIHNDTLRIIPTLGFEGWFVDETIDVAFELLDRYGPCMEQRIAFVGTTYAKSCYDAAKDVDFGKKYHFEDMRRFKNRSFIVFPINDAYNKKEYTVERSGGHWSLLLVDLRGPIQARYIDSSMVRDLVHTPTNFSIAKGVCKGLVRILQAYGNDVQVKPFTLDDIERNSPSQHHNNICEDDQDAACGPFVYQMAIEYSACIVNRNLGNGSGPVPWIDKELMRRKQFNSRVIRSQVFWRIFKAKQMMDGKTEEEIDEEMRQLWEEAAALEQW